MSLAKNILAQSKLKKAPVSKPFYSGLFDRQLEFLNDNQKRKAALATRRAGKTHATAIALIKAAYENPDVQCAYLHVNRDSAKNTMWEILQKQLKKFDIKFEPNGTSLTITLNNNSKIRLFGADNKDIIGKLRGVAFKLVVIDECASYRNHLEELIKEAIEPTLIDCDGSLVLIGTPGPNFSSFFYKVTGDRTQRGWSVHEWSFLQNPYVKAKEWLAEFLEANGLDESLPFIQREYFGRWVRTSDESVYNFNPEKCRYDSLPHFNLTYTIGIDVGFKDSDAICVIGYNKEESSDCFLIEEFKASKQNITQLGNEVKRLVEKYKPTRIIMDCGGLGLKIAEELNSRLGIYIEPAKKTEKQAYIELLNGDLQAGRIKLPWGTKLEKEMIELIWKVNENGSREENPKQDNHLCDAFLYSWRSIYNYLYYPKDTRVIPEEELFEQRVIESYNKRDEWANYY